MTPKDAGRHYAESEIIGAGRWLRLERLRFTDPSGRKRTWETAARQQGQAAVLMIPRLEPSGRYVLIKQFRAPVRGYVIEFPAGLIDPGEGVEKTAQRELLEETGYRGTVTWCDAPSLSSPGMCRESVTIVSVTIDETIPENLDPLPAAEEDEDIEVVLIDPDNVVQRLHELQVEGARVDSRVTAFFLGVGALG